MSEKTRGSWLPFHQRKNQKKDCEANIGRCRWPDCILPHKCSNWKTVECYFIQAAHCKHICISLRVNKLYICLWSANSSNHSHIISSFQFFFFLSISLVFYFSVFFNLFGKNPIFLWIGLSNSLHIFLSEMISYLLYWRNKIRKRGPLSTCQIFQSILSNISIGLMQKHRGVLS